MDTRPRILAAADLQRALPMVDAIAAAREAFTALAADAVVAPPRVHVVEGDRTTLLMGAAGAGARIAKVVSVFPGNASRGIATTTGVVTVLDPETGHVVGLCDGGALTAIRTGAAAGLATDLLARRDAEVGAVIGAGAQARTQVLALAAVRELREIRVFAPRRERVEAFVAETAPAVAPRLVIAESSRAAVAGAAVVSTATSSAEPVFDGAHLAAGAHVNAVGSFRLGMRELDERTIARADRIVVDLRESAMHEAGELEAAVAAGVTDPKRWLELGEVLADPSLRRAAPAEITLFKSVGHAAQDLFAARRAMRNAERLDLGRRVEL